jgi:mono/diheme cytochrome c family protein
MTDHRHSKVWVAGLFAVVSFAVATVSAQTIKNETAPRIQSMQGVDSYKAYCASCHGPEGKGNGPVAKALKEPPADLTTIAKRHGGKFSATDVEEMIAGRQVRMSHGSREMPVWGPVFQSLAADDSAAKLRMANLVNYVKSIQIQ